METEISKSKFKAQALEIFRRVEVMGEPVVITTAQQVTGQPIGFERVSRRAGDPAVLVASSARARDELGWQPRYTTLAPIIESAWRWHQRPCF